MLVLDRTTCGDLNVSGQREWLVTNGIGGYAAGTVAGVLTRRYHGLLIAALQPPVSRTLLVTKLDETAVYQGRVYPLFADRWADGSVEPAGFRHLERFHLEGTTPVWTYACADAGLEKRVWMRPGANTTYVRYDLRRATAPLTLRLQALVNGRDHHGYTRAAVRQPGHIEPVAHGLRITTGANMPPFYLLSDRATAQPQHEWRRGYFLSVEEYRGEEPLDDNLYVGLFETTLQPGESLTLVASLADNPDLDGQAAYDHRRAYETALLALARPHLPLTDPAIEQLVLAADQFIVTRDFQMGDNEVVAGQTIIAGYPWFADWGRDTMIALPGLTLTTGRPAVAARILRTFARFVDQGMLPNCFPDVGRTPAYNTVDATLWYFEAIRACHAATADEGLLRDLFPTLQDIIHWHQHGTRYSIQVDPSDGLLYAGEPGVQLTWMDAKVGDWVVTPRTGKPVEINALWYNALRVMADFARRLGEPAAGYEKLADQVRAGFARFWNPGRGYCYDVLDGPTGADPTLRPNQLLAVSLPHSPLDAAQQRAVVEVCAQHLLTPVGLRSLAPTDPAYIGHYGGDRRTRDAAYHQGTVWAWLIGPFISAHLRVYDDRAAARSFLLPLFEQLAQHGLGSISEIFDGDPPHTPRGCIAQAWSVAEVLRAWQEITAKASTPAR